MWKYIRGQYKRLIDEQPMTLGLFLWKRTLSRLHCLFTLCFYDWQLMAFKSQICLSTTLLELHVHWTKVFKWAYFLFWLVNVIFWSLHESNNSCGRHICAAFLSLHMHVMRNKKKQFSALSPTFSHFSESWIIACSSLWLRSRAAALHGKWKPKALPDAVLHNSLFSFRLQVHTKFHCRQAHTPGSDTSCLSFSYDGVTLASRGGKDDIFLCIVGAMHILRSTKIRESLSLPPCVQIESLSVSKQKVGVQGSLSETNRSNSTRGSFLLHFSLM